MHKTLTLANGRVIGKGHPAYIIAEMSANHAGDFELAKQIIKAAKIAGADCIKIQTYTPDTLTIDCDNEYFKIDSGTWAGENLYQLYQKAFTPWEWQAQLKKVAEAEGLDFLSTPFDKTAVDFLEEIGMSFYKIASFEVVDIPLVKYVASKGKPMIVSTGMASLGEIEECVQAIRSMGNEEICLLKCSSAYPAIPDDMNLRSIPHLSETFNVASGLSDHTLGSIAAVTAVAMDACVIEKHFCLSRDIENPDASFSMEPDEFKQMILDIRSAEKALGSVSYSVSKKESESKIFRKSIFVVQDIEAGAPLTPENIRVIRPGNGLAPKYYEEVLGQIATKNLKRGMPLNWQMFCK